MVYPEEVILRLKFCSRVLNQALLPSRGIFTKTGEVTKLVVKIATLAHDFVCYRLQLNSNEPIVLMCVPVRVHLETMFTGCIKFLLLRLPRIDFKFFLSTLSRDTIEKLNDVCYPFTQRDILVKAYLSIYADAYASVHKD